MATADSTVTYKDITGFPGYRVGDDGSVWNRWQLYRQKGRRLGDHWRLMKLSPGSRGYLRVNLVPPEGGSYRTFRVHRLVLEAFVGPCPEGMECRHLDGVKTNNRLTNIVWGTPEQNRDDIREHGTYPRGESHHMRRTLTDEDVRSIRLRYAAGGIGQKQLADEYSVSVPSVSMIVNRKIWQHVR